MAPSARFRRAHSRGKNGGENIEIQVVYDSPPLYCPMDSARPRAGMVRGLQNDRSMPESVDYEVPACNSKWWGPG